MRAETYADFAVQRAVAVARVTGSASSVGRAGPVIVEAAIRSTPHSALPVFRYGLILGLSRRELEPSLSGSVPGLRGDARPYVIRAVVRHQQRCDV